MGRTVHGSVDFQHSDPPWRVPMEMPHTFLDVRDLQVGDVVYTRRPGGYQRLAAVAGDTWRHVGLCVMLGRFPWLAEMGPGGFQARPMTTVFKAYDTVAVQRFHPCEHRCRAAFATGVCDRMQRPADFHSRTELAGIGLASLSRLRSASSNIGDVLRRRLTDRSEFNSRAICSTPLADSLQLLCAQHRVVLDVTSDKRVSPDVPAVGMTNMAMPDDVWRALQNVATPFWIRKDSNAVVSETQDLTSATKEVPQHV